MPLTMLIVGLIVVDTAIQGTMKNFGAQLRVDLLGDGKNTGFIMWLAILAILGVIGSVGSQYGRKDIRALTQMFITVVLVALVLRTPNLAQQFVEQLKGQPVTPANDVIIPGSSITSGSGSGSGSNEQTGDSGIMGTGVSYADAGKYATYAAMLL
jgi:hypothetical protein